ncbi:MAG: hypothetical protein JXB29_12740 [Sedimentisphaerales bacterium]|nr:hypothetical protein [Sedimentisphaerales bacterium]
MKIIEEPQLEIKRKLPWFIDAFLYPLNISGFIHITLFVLLPRLWSLFIKLSLSCIPPVYHTAVGEILGPLTFIFYVLVIGYLCYYIYDCLLDSAKGGIRAPIPTFGMNPYTANVWELISKIFLVLGSFAICYCWAAVYYIFARQTDNVFWLLCAIGSFLLPMSLLAGLMFGSFDALNPIMIVNSIYKTFITYWILLFFFYILVAMIVKILPRLPLWNLVISGLRIYLIFISSYLLGRFYWMNKDGLDWGI